MQVGVSAGSLATGTMFEHLKAHSLQTAHERALPLEAFTRAAYTMLGGASKANSYQLTIRAHLDTATIRQCVWPRMKLMDSGLAIWTAVNLGSIAIANLLHLGVRSSQHRVSSQCV
jgi:hypothetical protein